MIRVYGKAGNIAALNIMKHTFSHVVDTSSWKLSPLHTAILGLGPDEPEAILDKSTTDLDAEDAFGRTPLSWASQRGDYSNVDLCIRTGAELDTQDKMGNTAIHYAAQGNCSKTLRRLIGAKAKILDNNGGWTPLHHAACYQRDQCFVSALLRYHPAVDRRTNAGKTPLTLSALHNQIGSAQALIEADANIDTRDIAGWTPLRMAIQSGSRDCLELLMNTGPNLNSDPERQETVLHWAAQCSDVGVLECLQRHDLDMVDKNGRDVAGKTAREVFKSRNPGPPETIAAAFHKSMQSVRGLAWQDGHYKVVFGPDSTDL